MEIRNEYQKYGVEKFYKLFGKEYSNPHEPVIKQVMCELYSFWDLDFTNVLDLACGSGEITMTLQELGCDSITGIDPYTYEAYLNRTGRTPLRLSFEDIQDGILIDKQYSLIICSFAMHLLDQSRLPGLIYQLANISKNLVIITPHKKPQLSDEWGFKLVREDVFNRVRVRLYNSSLFCIDSFPSKQDPGHDHHHIQDQIQQEIRPV